MKKDIAVVANRVLMLLNNSEMKTCEAIEKIAPKESIEYHRRVLDFIILHGVNK